MGDTTKTNPSASGVIHNSLQVVKQSIVRLFTELREVGRGAENWAKAEPVLNRVEGSITNFFTKPEATTGPALTELKGTIQTDFNELKDICNRENLGVIEPFVAASEGMMTSFLTRWQDAH